MNETIADRYRRLSDRFWLVADSVDPDRLTASTPCDGWSVADVVEHVVATQHEFLHRMGFAGDSSTDDPGSIRQAMQAALDDPAKRDHRFDGYFGPTTFAETVDQFYSMDLMVHAWDIARGAGLAELEALDPSDMACARSSMAPMSEAVRMPGIFGPEVEPAADASEQDRFLAWTGRRP